MTNLATTPAFVKLGKRVFLFTSFESVSQAYCEACDRTDATVSGVTGPRALDCHILDDAGNVIAFVSYNGKIWGGANSREWTPGTLPIYSPTS